MRQRADDRLSALFFSFGAAFVDTVVWDNEPSVSAEGQESRHKCTVESTESPFKLLLSALLPLSPEGFQKSDHSKETWGSGDRMQM